MKLRTGRVLALLALVTTVGLAAPSVSSKNPTGLANGKFDLASDNDEPEDWKLEPRTSGYSAQIVEKGCRQRKCLHVTPPAEGPFSSAAVVQNFDPGETRGRYALVEYSARLDPAFPRGRAQVTFSQYRKGSPVPVSRRSRPIEQTRWESVSYRTIVIPDADRLAISIQASGGVAVFADAISVKPDIRLKGSELEPPRELTQQGLDNLVAFSQLYAVLRFFHPSTGLRTLDWQENAVEGVRMVEGAKTSADLAKLLLGLYKKQAPSVQILSGEEATQKHRDLRLAPGGTNISVAVMKHVGFGLPRDTDAMGSMVTEEFVNQPNEPEVFELRLTPDVRALIPLQLPRDRTRAPQVLPARFVHLPNRLPAPLRSANDRTGRLANIVIAWSTLRYFHPYAGKTKPDWEAMLRYGLGEAAAQTGDLQFRRTLQKMLAPLQDRHAEVSHPVPIRRLTSYSLESIEGQMVVTSSDRADEATPGDVLVAINGNDLRSGMEPGIGLRFASTPGCAEDQAMNFAMDSMVEESNQLKFRHFPDRLAPNGRSQVLQRPSRAVGEIEPGVFYIDLSRMTTRAFEARAKDLSEARGLVFDLRNGSIASSQILGFFTRSPLDGFQLQVPIVIRPDEFRFQKLSEMKVPAKPPYLSGTRVFLAGERTRGSAEMLLGMVQHYQLGKVVGGTTCGSSGDIARFGLLGGYAIQFSGVKTIRHDGSDLHGRGIVPDVAVRRTRKGVAEGRDEVLERGIVSLSQ